ncbi:MAG: hypothetical protein HZB19_04750 [Chloroflexi bacterium]|nr:hypothetical protein [Chloroflexota bacterium]
MELKNNTISPVRVILKSLALFVLANVLFAAFRPPIGKLTFYNWLVPGRSRFPFEQPENMATGYNVPLFEDLDATFASHEISGTAKQPDEYRVVLLGDSSIWGIGNQPDKTIEGQLNRLDLKTCDGRPIHFYNLGYPRAFIIKDLLILDRAIAYQPDMVLWFITLYTLNSEDGRDDFLVPHFDEVNRLVEEYNLRNYTRGFSPESFLEQTIVGQRGSLKRGILLQLDSFLWASTSIDHRIQVSTLWKDEIGSNAEYLTYRSADDWNKLKRTFMLDVIDAGHQAAGNAPVVFVNEPIYIADGTAGEVRYNSSYPRWAYDLYRSYMDLWMKEKGYFYVDLWNAIPGKEFGDSSFHLSPEGERMMAGQLAPSVINYSCSNP